MLLLPTTNAAVSGYFYLLKILFIGRYFVHCLCGCVDRVLGSPCSFPSCGDPEALIQVKILFGKKVLLKVGVLQPLEEKCENYFFTEITLVLTVVALYSQITLSGFRLEGGQEC